MADYNQNPPNQPIVLAESNTQINILIYGPGVRIETDPDRYDYETISNSPTPLDIGIGITPITEFSEQFKSNITIFDLFLAYLTYQCPEPDYPREGQVYPLFDHNKTD